VMSSEAKRPIDVGEFYLFVAQWVRMARLKKLFYHFIQLLVICVARSMISN